MDQYDCCLLLTPELPLPPTPTHVGWSVFSKNYAIFSCTLIFGPVESCFSRIIINVNDYKAQVLLINARVDGFGLTWLPFVSENNVDICKPF